MPERLGAAEASVERPKHGGPLEARAGRSQYPRARPSHRALQRIKGFGVTSRVRNDREGPSVPVQNPGTRKGLAATYSPAGAGGWPRIAIGHSQPLNSY